MKRKNHLFPLIVDKDNLREAHRNASKGKQHYREVQEINKNLDAYIDTLHEMLVNKTFTTSTYKEMTRMEGGKMRDISVLPYFPDRIVHHAIMQVCGEFWKNSLIRDTFQSIRGRGTSDARKRVLKGVRESTHFLQLDIKKFYPSVPTWLLEHVVTKSIKCKDTLWLLFDIIRSHQGLPIGNYISQLLGNLCLSPLDWYIKQELKVRWYFRYCDDLVLMGSKQQLKELLPRVVSKVESLGLLVKPDYKLGCLENNGLDFCGYVFKKNNTRVRARIKEKFLQSVEEGKNESLPSYYGWILPLENRGLWYENTRR